MSLKHEHQAEQEADAAAWHRKAEFEGYRCAIDGEVISYDDREQYFSTKLCSYHADQAQKDS